MRVRYCVLVASPPKTENNARRRPHALFRSFRYLRACSRTRSPVGQKRKQRAPWTARVVPNLSVPSNLLEDRSIQIQSGGGGSRTPVRKQSTYASTGIACELEHPVNDPTSRELFRFLSDLISRISRPIAATDGLAYWYYTERPYISDKCAGTSLMRLEQPRYYRWQLSVLRVFRRPPAPPHATYASLPPSKPVRPRNRKSPA